MKEIDAHNRKLAADYEKNLAPVVDEPVFSERLRLELIAIRKASGLNLEQFAYACGLGSKQHVWGVENGAGITMEYIDKVDRTFGVWR